MATDLTFFVWADTHFGYDQRFGDEDQRGRIIEQMHNLPGWPYPVSVGGAPHRSSSCSAVTPWTAPRGRAR